MDNKVYKITLTDGTVIENLSLNGSIFTSNESIDPSVFADNCSSIIIDDGIEDNTIDNVELLFCNAIEGGCEFAFRQYTSDELKQLKMQSDIEYLAMMTGIEL